MSTASILLSPPPVTLSVDELCRLLRIGPTAIPVLAHNGDIYLYLPARRGYCPQLDDVQIVLMRRNLPTDLALLRQLRQRHPQDACGHLHRATALGGVLRVLGR